MRWYSLSHKKTISMAKLDFRTNQQVGKDLLNGSFFLQSQDNIRSLGDKELTTMY